MERHLETYIHPGRTFLEEVVKPNNLKIGAVADLLQVSRLTVSKIVNEKKRDQPKYCTPNSDCFWWECRYVDPNAK